MSLNHEYDKAIQAFKRAIQLAPDTDYPYTLLGNEYSLIDELERAMACFRKAIQLNVRSYKAWSVNIHSFVFFIESICFVSFFLGTASQWFI